MTLKQKLQKESRNTIEDYALRFACNVEPILFEEAQNGKSKMQFNLDEKDKHIVTSPIFISAVNELLEGVKVEVVQVSTKSLFPSFKKEFLQLSWGDLND
ncbi:hypothetical protein [Lysinibacillus sp. NPDC086135]|uniref:hypothetical protein n=1 Tax=Lysinibacillus sp. NPDC086135 TaxID=3364130 RepID=UPI0037F2108A